MHNLNMANVLNYFKDEELVIEYEVTNFKHRSWSRYLSITSGLNKFFIWMICIFLEGSRETTEKP